MTWQNYGSDFRQMYGVTTEYKQRRALKALRAAVLAEIGWWFWPLMRGLARATSWLVSRVS